MKKNFIIVLNDNKMSISENVGGMSRYLNGLRTGSGYNDLKKKRGQMPWTGFPWWALPMIDKIKRTKNSIKQLFIPGMLFENMGITYLGPVDGHNISQALQGVPGGEEAGSRGAGPCYDEKGQGLQAGGEESVPFPRGGPL